MAPCAKASAKKAQAAEKRGSARSSGFKTRSIEEQAARVLEHHTKGWPPLAKGTKVDGKTLKEATEEAVDQARVEKKRLGRDLFGLASARATSTPQRLVGNSSSTTQRRRCALS